MPAELNDAVDHVGRRLRTLEECALHRRTFRVTCPACGHVRLLDAVPLWWLFVKRGWDERLPAAMRKLYCTPCGKAGQIVRPWYVVTREQPEGPQPPYPERREWNRIVSRYRS
jgi:hypothetical protein